MPYIPHTWVFREVVDPEDLNNIESGISLALNLPNVKKITYTYNATGDVTGISINYEDESLNDEEYSIEYWASGMDPVVIDGVQYPYQAAADGEVRRITRTIANYGTIEEVFGYDANGNLVAVGRRKL